jgi:DNA-binding SARP family transcriptional activator
MIARTEGVHIQLLGGFECSCSGRRIPLPLGAQRLLGLLALEEGGVHRGAAAERLWPNSSPGRAAGNLRSALWRARRLAEVTVVRCDGPRLRIAPAVCIDLQVVESLSRKALEGGSPIMDLDYEALIDALSLELLPDWVDDWLVLERDRWEQVRLHALEGVAQMLRSREQYLGALRAALAAVAVEPIRESAHRIIVEVHLDEGNTGSALRHYQRYRSLLQRELGVAPSPRMTQLANALLS